MKFETWTTTDDWAFGDEFKVIGDVIDDHGRVSVGNFKVIFRDLVDVTTALDTGELKKFEQKLADAFLDRETA